MRSVYEACFYGGLILAILFLITAIILFIALKIPKVFNELTGRAAKKLMETTTLKASTIQITQSIWYDICRSGRSWTSSFMAF